MDDKDDPFLGVKPGDGRMNISSYFAVEKRRGSGHSRSSLEKRLGSGHSRSSLESSSQGTLSTRSTTTSSVPDDNRSTLPPRSPRQSSQKIKARRSSRKENREALEFGSDFGNGLEFGQGSASGDDGMSGSSSRGLNSSSQDAFDAFGADPFDGWTSSFGDDDDVFGGAVDDAFGANFGDEHVESLEFHEAFPSRTSPPVPQKKEEPRTKREALENSARPKSGSVGVSRGQGERRTGGPLRRRHSSGAVNLVGRSPSSNRQKLGRRERPIGQDRHHSPDRRRDHSSDGRRVESDEKGIRRSAPRRERSSRRERRATTEHDGTSQASSRGNHDIPGRSKSQSRDTTGGDRRRESKKKNWTEQRSRKQEMIISMYRDGGMTKGKGEGNGSNHDSIGSLDLAFNIEDMSIQDEMNNSGNNNSAHSLRAFITRNSQSYQLGTFQSDEDDSEQEEQGKEQNAENCRKQKPDELSRSSSSRGDRRDDRSTATLLERVGGTTSIESSPRSARSSVGRLSYSDRIMLASKRKG